MAGPGAAAAGGGLLLGELGEDGGLMRAGPRRPFASSSVEPAAPGHVEALHRAGDAALEIGTWSSGGVDVAARLRAQGFGRHTFLCGQRGGDVGVPVR